VPGTPLLVQAARRAEEESILSHGVRDARTSKNQAVIAATKVEMMIATAMIIAPVGSEDSV